MRIFVAALLLCIWRCVEAEEPACGTCTNDSPEPIIPVPPPWFLGATVFALPMAPAFPLPTKAYSPLERNSTAMEGNYVGLVGAILIIRYDDTPVGPYDELVLLPGFFEYPRNLADGTVEIRHNVRGSRFYVSQKYTTWNGRVNWNIPKHLAQFNWTENDDGSTSVSIYPFDTDNQPSESFPSTLPFFSMTFTPDLPAIPIPLNTDILTYLGINPWLGQAPLPAGNGSYNELPGTTHWAETLLGTTSNFTQTGIINMDQGTGDDTGDGYNAVGDEFYPNFWPSLPKLNVGVKLLQANVSFPVPETWEEIIPVPI